MVSLHTFRVCLVLVLLIGAVSIITPQVSHAEFSDGHGGHASFTASDKFNGNSGCSASQNQVEADAGGPYTVDENQSIMLIGSGSCANGQPIKSYAWDAPSGNFEDGTGENETYYAPSVDEDTYLTVTLTVENNHDSDSDTARVRVRDTDGN